MRRQQRRCQFAVCHKCLASVCAFAGKFLAFKMFYSMCSVIIITSNTTQSASWSFSFAGLVVTAEHWAPIGSDWRIVVKPQSRLGYSCLRTILQAEPVRARSCDVNAKLAKEADQLARRTRNCAVSSDSKGSRMKALRLSRCRTDHTPFKGHTVFSGLASSTFQACSFHTYVFFEHVLTNMAGTAIGGRHTPYTLSAESILYGVLAATVGRFS